MKKQEFEIAIGINERIDKLEKTIFKLQGIMNKKSYHIVATDIEFKEVVVLNPGEIATEGFVQDILDYYVNTLNLELNDLRKSLDDILDD